MSKNNKKGFTIIEVVLVLAIAGLIFLMVFIALPALQRSQRNTRRRQDMARILSSFNDYQSNNNSKMPDSTGKIVTFVKRYVDDQCTSTVLETATATMGSVAFTGCSDQFTDPDGTPYTLTLAGTLTTSGQTGNGSTQDHEIMYYRGAKCNTDSEGQAIYGGGNNGIAIILKLEGGAFYCGDNQ